MVEVPLGWRKLKLGEVMTLKRGYDLPAYERQQGDIPVVTSSGINDTHSEAKVEGPGVVTGRYGTLGEVYYLENAFWPHNTTLYVRDFKGNHPYFIYFFLQSLSFGIYNDKSSVPGLNRNHLHTMEVILPPIDEQRAIADVLGSLDDKIEANRRQNETLEATARAIFKSWFVDFDPVHAKASGEHPPGMDAETAALFPDSFEESELGLIPRGWEVGTLGEIAANPRRSIQPEEVPTDTFYVGLEHIPQQSLALSEWGFAEDVNSNKYNFNEGEILFGKLRPYFHKVVFAPISGICSTDILVITPNHDFLYGFAVMHLSSVAVIEYATRVSTGTRMPRANWKNLSQYPIVLPSVELLEAFNCTLLPIFEQIQNNVYQSRTLAETRDALLPRLVSGELRVGELEA